jgi:hypothetical protein
MEQKLNPVTSATFTGNAIDGMCCLLWISFHLVLMSELLKVCLALKLSQCNDSLFIWAFPNALHIWDIHRAKRFFLSVCVTDTLGINNWVNETGDNHQNFPPPPLWSSVQSFWLHIQRSRVRFPSLPDFLRSSGSGPGSTQSLRTTEELLEGKAAAPV